jgi:hypothetical protein
MSGADMAVSSGRQGNRDGAGPGLRKAEKVGPRAVPLRVRHLSAGAFFCLAMAPRDCLKRGILKVLRLRSDH